MKDLDLLWSTTFFPRYEPCFFLRLKGTSFENSKTVVLPFRPRSLIYPEWIFLYGEKQDYNFNFFLQEYLRVPVPLIEKSLLCPLLCRSTSIKKTNKQANKQNTFLAIYGTECGFSIVFHWSTLHQYQTVLITIALYIISQAISQIKSSHLDQILKSESGYYSQPFAFPNIFYKDM